MDITAIDRYRYDYGYRIRTDVGIVIVWADYHSKSVITYEAFILIDFYAEQSIIAGVLYYPRLQVRLSVGPGTTGIIH